MISLGTPSLLMLDAGEATELLRGDRRLISELAGDGCWELDSLDFRFLRNIYDFLCQKARFVLLILLIVMLNTVAHVVHQLCLAAEPLLTFCAPVP